MNSTDAAELLEAAEKFIYLVNVKSELQFSGAMTKAAETVCRIAEEEKRRNAAELRSRFQDLDFYAREFLQTRRRRFRC